MTVVEFKHRKAIKEALLSMELLLLGMEIPEWKWGLITDIMGFLPCGPKREAKVLDKKTNYFAAIWLHC